MNKHLSLQSSGATSKGVAFPEEPQQEWMALGDREIQVVSITPREKEPPSRDEEMEWLTPLQRIRRIMEGEI